MLLNKTQSFVEAQKVLFERIGDINWRNSYALIKDVENKNIYDVRVNEKYNEYETFLSNSKIYDEKIINKQNYCKNLETAFNLCIILLIIFSIGMCLYAVLQFKHLKYK